MKSKNDPRFMNGNDILIRAKKKWRPDYDEAILSKKDLKSILVYHEEVKALPKDKIEERLITVKAELRIFDWIVKENVSPAMEHFIMNKASIDLLCRLMNETRLRSDLLEKSIAMVFKSRISSRPSYNCKIDPIHLKHIERYLIESGAEFHAFRFFGEWAKRLKEDYDFSTIEKLILMEPDSYPKELTMKVFCEINPNGLIAENIVFQ